MEGAERRVEHDVGLGRLEVVGGELLRVLDDLVGRGLAAEPPICNDFEP